MYLGTKLSWDRGVVGSLNVIRKQNIILNQDKKIIIKKLLT